MCLALYMYRTLLYGWHTHRSAWHRDILYSVHQRIYVLVIEGTASAIALQRCDSPNLSPPVLSDGQVVGEYCRQSVERLGESHLCKTLAGAVPSITNIYSLVYALQGGIDSKKTSR